MVYIVLAMNPQNRNLDLFHLRRFAISRRKNATCVNGCKRLINDLSPRTVILSPLRGEETARGRGFEICASSDLPRLIGNLIRLAIAILSSLNGKRVVEDRVRGESVVPLSTAFPSFAIAPMLARIPMSKMRLATD